MMVNDMKELYNRLLTLAAESEAFFFKEDTLDNVIYRIFNYRLASYTEFLKPGGLECRGIMFEVDAVGDFVRIASRPMAKFFNLYENPLTMDLDLTKVVRLMDKADGSLISSYLHNNRVRLKSKGSLNSDQANDSNDYFQDKRHNDLLILVDYLVKQGFTVNFEWCAPHNRIVLAYAEPELKILNVRHNVTGDYLDIWDGQHFGNHTTMVKYRVDHSTHEDPVAFLAKVPDMSESIEGFVCEMEDGMFFKIKTLAYLALHKSKDSINSPRRLYEAVLLEATDDLRSLFHDDPVAIQLIQDMEDKVGHLYNHVVDMVEKFYAANKHLERKEYAIAGQKDLEKKFFGLAMNLYLDKPFSYKEFMIKRWKDFGIKDVEKVEE